MNVFRARFMAATVALLLFTGGSAEAKPVAKAIFKKPIWFDFTFQGNKVGFLYAMDEDTLVNGKPAIHARRWSVITVRRKNDIIRMESTIDAWFDKSGAPMRFKRFNREGGEVRSGTGYRDGNQFIVETNVGGNLKTHKFQLDKDTHLSLSLDSLFNHKLAVGQGMSGKAIIEEDGQLKPFTKKVVKMEKTKHGEVFVVEDVVAGIESRALVRPNGRPIEITMPRLGASFVETTKEKAILVETPVDIFSSAMFQTVGLPPGHEIDELVVRLSGKSGRRPTYIADTRQTAKELGKSGVELKIAVGRAPKKGPRLPIKTPKLKRYLSETPYEALKDERLVATANRVVGDTKDAWAAAKLINRFVYRHIVTKSLARAFATATEALEAKEGDCTEHAVLFSALAKIAGIPTRLVTGLVYVDDQSVFGYHEWVEVWMGSGWVAMDPTFGQDIADPTHIKFAQGLSDADGLREAGMVAASLIGDLKLKVVSVKTADGKKQTF